MLYPINLEIKDMKITIIGGGDVAYRKCKNFLEFGKSVRVVSPEFIDSFELIKNNVELVYDVYKEEYIKDSFIVVAATNNKEINKNENHLSFNDLIEKCKNSRNKISHADDKNIYLKELENTVYLYKFVLTFRMLIFNEVSLYRYVDNIKLSRHINNLDSYIEEHLQ